MVEEIDLGQLFSYFKSKWFYILFAVSLAFCVSSIYVNQFRTLEYTSYTKIILNQSSGETITSSDVNLNQSLVSDYSEIIKSKLVLNQVIELLDLEYEYEDLVRMVNVSGINDTSVIKVSVTNEDPDLACSISSSIATVFMKEVADIYKIDNISILDDAEVPTKTSSTSALKIIAVAILAGAFVSCGIIFVFFYFDTTIKSEEVIESATGIPVIGLVPYVAIPKKNGNGNKIFDKTSEVIVERMPERERVTRGSEYKVVGRKTRKKLDSEV